MKRRKREWVARAAAYRVGGLLFEGGGRYGEFATVCKRSFPGVLMISTRLNLLTQTITKDFFEHWISRWSHYRLWRFDLQPTVT